MTNFCVRMNYGYSTDFFCVRTNLLFLCHNFGVRRNERNIMSSVFTSKDIGAVIRAERKRQKLTQTELCAVSLSFVSNLENGKTTTELEKTLKVLNTLGLDVMIAKRGE